MVLMKIRLPNAFVVATIAALLGGLTGSGTALLRATTTPLRNGSFTTLSIDTSGPVSYTHLTLPTTD